MDMRQGPRPHHLAALRSASSSAIQVHDPDTESVIRLGRDRGHQCPLGEHRVRSGDMHGRRDAEGDSATAQLGSGHSHREVVVDDVQDVQQYTGVGNDPRALPLSLQETQDRHPQAHVAAGRRGMDEPRDLFVSPHGQQSRAVQDVVLGVAQRDDSASASAALWAAVASRILRRISTDSSSVT